ncbi:MAG: hypothetical protein U0R49_03245 [Fimbriimonadales bacterium]
MKRDFIYVSVGMLCLAAYAVAGLGGGQQNTQSLPIVFLQNSTPGTPQTGHTNVSGTATASQFVGGGTGLTNVNADLLDGLNSTAFLQTVPNPLSLSNSLGGPTIKGTNTSGLSGSSGVMGENSAASGNSYGVYGLNSSANGRAVQGWASSLSGLSYGGHFFSDSSLGIGVYGNATSTSGVTFGGSFVSSSSSGTGVRGIGGSSTGSTIGGAFYSYSSGGKGVVGEVSSATGPTVGGQFESASSSGTGVFGLATALTGVTYGTYGQSDSSTGRGVYGFTSATGAADTPYGVRGSASTATGGYGVYAAGDLGASGVKSFRIDHPFDPENKYLLHYSSESPFPQNFYNGNTVTDANGYAWVELPDYFSAINTNFKYQLTVLDNSDDFVLAKVTREIEQNRFQIRTSKPSVKVSWMVFADRNDLRIKQNPPTDVREKGESEKDKYQHPEYYGLGPERGMDYDPKREAMRKERGATGKRQ